MEQIQKVELTQKLQHKVSTAQQENEKMRAKVLSQQEQLESLLTTSIATAKALSVYREAKGKFEEPIEVLANVQSAVEAVKEPEKQEETDKRVSFYIKLMELLSSMIQENQESISFSDLLSCEDTLREYLYYAEDEGTIPGTPEESGWKKSFHLHRQSFE